MKNYSRRPTAIHNPIVAIQAVAFFISLIFATSHTNAANTITDIDATSTTAISADDAFATFGQIFALGDVPAGKTVVAQTADGKPLPTQIDSKAAHADGSLRHAVITVKLPAMKPKKPIKFALIRAEKSVQTAPPTTTALLATGYNAVTTLLIDGKVYRAATSSALSGTIERTWLSGPLATEWHVTVPFTTSSGSAHPHLSARYAIRAYAGLKRIRTSVVVENTWAYEPNPSNLDYDVSVDINGKNVLSRVGLLHHHHARWQEVFWSPDATEIALKFDTAYWLRTRAIPNYDRNIKIPESRLEKLAASWAAADNGPMGAGLLQPYMPTTGARPDIAPLPSWTAIYWLSMDSRALETVLGTGSRAGAWPIHYRDQATQLPLSIDLHPHATIFGNEFDATNPDTKQSEAFPACAKCEVKLDVDSAHQPSLAYTPYAITGDYYYLEELQFWATYNLMQANPYYRETTKGLVKWDQLRGQAWSLRTLADAAYITPDAHPLKSYFVSKIKNNLDWYNANYTNNPKANKLGWIDRLFADEPKYWIAHPWEDDFFTWAIRHAVDLGFTEAIPLLKYKAQFAVKRMTTPGYCWIFAAAYELPVATFDHTPYTSLAEIYPKLLERDYPAKAAKIQQTACGSAAMGELIERRPGEMIGYPHIANGFVTQMSGALSAAVDYNIPGAREAWRQYATRPIGVSAEDFGNEPEWALVPQTKP